MPVPIAPRPVSTLPVTGSPSPAKPAVTTAPVIPSRVIPKPDPLAVTMANGTTFSPVDRTQLTAAMNEALKLGADVPGRVQDGPTCGLYALGMVMDFWDRKDSKNLNPLVQNPDVVRWDAKSAPADTERRMLDEAKAKGFTTQGEMFYADQLASLANSFGYHSTVHENFSLQDLYRVLDKKHPALVGFDVDNNGNPGMFGGKRAHWAVIEGHFQKDGIDYLVATHGWTGKEYVWKASDLMASINQMDKSDFPAAPKDITRTLKGRLVEVVPGNLKPSTPVTPNEPVKPPAPVRPAPFDWSGNFW